jgi:hypothetical protein
MAQGQAARPLVGVARGQASRSPYGEASRPLRDIGEKRHSVIAKEPTFRDRLKQSPVPRDCFGPFKKTGPSQ